MHRRVYDNLKDKPRLRNKHASLQTVNGEPLKLDGCAEINFEIGGLKMSHLFFVVPDMNRNLILGRDWLENNGVRMYFDLGCIRVNQTYIPLQEDMRISSVIRVHKKTKIKPQTAIVCRCKVQNNSELLASGVYKISPPEVGFFNYQPGLMITHCQDESK